jgi:hypothetical protein
MRKTGSRHWLTFINHVGQARASLRLRPGEECFYRGHRNRGWELLPTLQRHCRITKRKSRKKVQDVEADLFFEFQARSAQLDHSSRDDWDLLFTMRHHGIATRLLDWTEVFGVALYFAVRNVSESDSPHIWLLNPYRLNVQNWSGRDLVSPKWLGYDDRKDEVWDYSEFLIEYSPPGMGWSRPVALYPVQRNYRLHAQRGYFTIHGDQNRAIDLTNPKCVHRVDIPRQAIPAAREFLLLAGINDYSMFPDLDGLAHDLHQKNSIT